MAYTLIPADLIKFDNLAPALIIACPFFHSPNSPFPLLYIDLFSAPFGFIKLRSNSYSVVPATKGY